MVDHGRARARQGVVVEHNFVALSFRIGEAPGPRDFSREDGDHRSLGSLFVRAARPLMTLSRRRQRAAADGGDELITNLGGAQAAPSAVGERRLLLASPPLFSDHERCEPPVKAVAHGRRFSLVPYVLRRGAIDSWSDLGQSARHLGWPNTCSVAKQTTAARIAARRHLNRRNPQGRGIRS